MTKNIKREIKMTEKFVLKSVCGEDKIFKKEDSFPMTEKQIVNKLNTNEEVISELIEENNLLQNKEFANYFDHLHESDWRQFIHFGKNENWYPFEDVKAVTKFEFPVLFIVGEKKRNETIGASIYPEINSNVRIAIVPFAGHLVHDEQPEIYTKILEVFIKTV